uniref:Uncharacterized protein n=1 Tax=Timema cristinae TaxID=61476 RepID=A0A7R9CMR9_TIMCR|nr:unnamed protein product [Timema cristinae]
MLYSKCCNGDLGAEDPQPPLSKNYFSSHPPVYEKDTKIFVWNCVLHSASDIVFDCFAHAHIREGWGGRRDCQVERALLLSQCWLWRDGRADKTGPFPPNQAIVVSLCGTAAVSLLLEGTSEKGEGGGADRVATPQAHLPLTLPVTIPDFSSQDGKEQHYAKHFPTTGCLFVTSCSPFGTDELLITSIGKKLGSQTQHHHLATLSDSQLAGITTEQTDRATDNQLARDSTRTTTLQVARRRIPPHWIERSRNTLFRFSGLNVLRLFSVTVRLHGNEHVVFHGHYGSVVSWNFLEFHSVENLGHHVVTELIHRLNKHHQQTTTTTNLVVSELEKKMEKFLASQFYKSKFTLSQQVLQ